MTEEFSRNLSMTQNENKQTSPISSNGQKILHNSFEIIHSTSICTNIPIKNKNDSAYSSLISQRNSFIRNSSPVVIQANNKNESPGTSYSSYNSGFVNDEELEEMFPNSGQFLPIEKSGERVPEKSLYLPSRLTDYIPENLSIHQSFRSSPWTVRPDSAPLNEEDEDSDKEASEYSCSLPHEPVCMTDLPEVILCAIQSKDNSQRPISDSEQRNELIASKLREIADDLNPSSIKIRRRYNSVSSESIKRCSRRHSHSSFADIVPCGCGSALDLFLSLYNVYRNHSKAPPSVANSQSMANMNLTTKRLNSRNRSYTQ